MASFIPGIMSKAGLLSTLFTQIYTISPISLLARGLLNRSAKLIVILSYPIVDPFSLIHMLSLAYGWGWLNDRKGLMQRRALLIVSTQNVIAETLYQKDLTNLKKLSHFSSMYSVIQKRWCSYYIGLTSFDEVTRCNLSFLDLRSGKVYLSFQNGRCFM